MKESKRLYAWLVAAMLVLASVLPVGSAMAAEEEAEELPEVEIVSLFYDEESALYDYQNGQEIGVGMFVTLKNNTLSKGTYTIQMIVTENYDESTRMEGTPATVEIGGGETSDRIYLLGPTVRDAGFYNTNLQIKKGDVLINAVDVGFCVIHPAHEGIMEDSIFGMNARQSTTTRMSLLKEICQKIGVKWARGVNYTSPAIVKPTKDGPYWSEAEIQRAIDDVLDWQKYDISCMGAVDYNMPWNVMPIPGRTNHGAHENRPLDMQAQADMIYHLVKPLKDYVKVWETWNEPWIVGWTWATGTSQDYRDYCKIVWDTIRADSELDDIKIIGGGSTAYSRDIMYPMDENREFTTAYVDGTSNHAYGVPEQYYAGMMEVQRYLDENYSVGKGQGGMWQTEIATSWDCLSGTWQEIDMDVARGVAPMHLQHLQASGGVVPVKVFWFALGLDNGYSGDDFNMYEMKYNTPYAQVAAYSAASHFIENNKLDENWDIYPDSKNLFGYMLEDRTDGKATGIFFLDNDHEGSATINNAKGLRIYNYMGKELSDGSKDSVTIDLLHWESVYVESDLTPEELMPIMRDIDFDIAKPVLIYPLSFVKPLSTTGSITFRVENASNKTVSGDITLTSVPEGWEMKETTVALTDMKPGEKATIEFPILTYKESDKNLYYLDYKATFNGQTWEEPSRIQVAYAPKKTVTIDGSLDDWEGVPTVSMVDNSTGDFLTAVLNPNLREEVEKQTTGAAISRTTYKAKTAWDDDYFYFAAEVSDETPQFKVPFLENDYLFPFQSDGIQIAFDVIEHNPDDIFYGKLGYDKYYASDVDYEFSLNRTISGTGEVNSEMERLMAPGTNVQGYYPENPPQNPQLGVIDAYEAGGPDGRIKIAYNEQSKVLTYEAAIAWKNISELKSQLDALGADSGLDIHFAWAVNDFGTDARGTSYWTREANILESGVTGFAPRWKGGQKLNGGRIITPWGLGNFNENPIKITLNGKNLAMDVAPVIMSDRTMVPLRAIFEALDAQVDWNGDTRTITATKGDTVITLQIDSATATVNGQDITIDAPATIKNDRTLVPVRFVSENLDAEVGWNADTATVSIQQ